MIRALQDKVLIRDILRDVEAQAHSPKTYAASVEPMRKPDHKAKKHGKIMPWMKGALRTTSEAARTVSEAAAVAAFICMIGVVSLGMGVGA